MIPPTLRDSMRQALFLSTLLLLMPLSGCLSGTDALSEGDQEGM